MIVLNDIAKWVPLAGGEVIRFGGKRPRPIKLEMNTSEPAVIMIHIDGEDVPRLLARVTGRETLSFVVPGPFEIMHRSIDAEVYVLAADGAKVHRENMAVEAYTTLHERRARNPELEFIQWQMNKNMEKRLAMQAAEFERRLRNVDSGKSIAGDGSEQAERPGNGVAPVEGAGGTAAPEGGGNAGSDDSAGNA